MIKNNEFKTTYGYLAVILAIVSQSPSMAQLRIVETIQGRGIVQSIFPGRIKIQTATGETLEMFYQTADDRAVMVDKGTRALNMPTKIEVFGRITKDQLEPGTKLKLSLALGPKGKAVVPLQSAIRAPTDAEMTVNVTAEASAEETQEKKEEDGNTAEAVTADVVGKVKMVRKDRIVLIVPRSEVTPRAQILANLDASFRVNFTTSSLKGVQAGDQVVQFKAQRLNTGDWIAAELTIEQALHSEPRARDLDEQLAARHAHLPDAPVAMRDVTSAHFLIHTDLSDRKSAILLDKLETMLKLISGYFQRPPKNIIECVVVDDIGRWPGGLIPPAAMAKIAAEEGVTLSRSLTRSINGRPVARMAEAVVYSCGNPKVVQHEVVHAFCSEAFGSTGPTWYAEGMAEMGAYWRENEKAVYIEPIVIEYLRHAKPKKMIDIVASGQITGDSWKAYAWRWALCHLLTNNPNYAQRFRLLGRAMMEGQSETFESMYGDVAAEISFEYDQFLRQLANGYRVDLCAWEWPRKTFPITGSRLPKVTVKADRGWQCSRLTVQEGTRYDYVAKGNWRCSALSAETDADGNATAGRLVAAVLSEDYVLSEPIPLGVRGDFLPPSSGHLYLRCQDTWTELGDNQGEMIVHFRKSNVATERN